MLTNTKNADKAQSSVVLARGGFTIVELLIVIVVIGILAAIVIVAYNGVTNRATNLSVESDLTNLSKQAEAFRVLNDRYPVGTADLNAMKVKLTKNSYRLTGNNFIYCYESNGSKYGVMAITTASSTRYIVSDTQSNPIVAPSSFSSYTSGNDICPALGVTTGSWSWAYSPSTGWAAYTGGS